MDHIFLLLLAGATSAGGFLLGVWGLGIPRARLHGGILRALELAGASVVFLLVNLAVGISVILAVRTFTTHFLSAYLLNDVALVVLSAFQGIVFECWRRS
jgi:hypothetical protein